MSEKLGIKEIFLGVIPLNSIKPIFATFLPKKPNSALPQQIVFYRDGVSEGQFMYVMDFEIRKIKLALMRNFQILGSGAADLFLGRQDLVISILPTFFFGDI